jgi:2-methylisocitrate lyase-like PEP mutase family enzyme
MKGKNVLKKSTLFRKRIEKEKGLWNPCCYDCISARIFEKAGADIISVSGYGISLSLLGMPDMGFISLSEMAMVTRFVSNAIDVPVMADADTGFGNALNVIRTTREMIQAGAASMLIEDQLSPKRCGHVAGKQVIPIEEAVGKYRAAADERDKLDPDFVLVARTDGRGAVGGSVEEAVKRANAYLDAGADVAFVEGLTSKEELQYVVDSVHGPVLYNMIGLSPLIPLPELKQMGVAIIGFGMSHFAATKAIWDFAHGLKQSGIEAYSAFRQELKGHPVEDDHAFAGFPQMKALEEKYLPEGQIGEKYKSSLGYQP